MWTGTKRKAQYATCVMCYNMKWALTYLSQKGKIRKIILESANFKQNCVIHKTRVNTVRSTYCRPLCCLQCLSFCSKKETIPSRTIFLCPWHKNDETFLIISHGSHFSGLTNSLTFPVFFSIFSSILLMFCFFNRKPDPL